MNEDPHIHSLRQHGALVEDLLDRAGLAVTGRVGSPARRPKSVRIANAIEPRVARRRGMLASNPRTGRQAQINGGSTR